MRRLIMSDYPWDAVAGTQAFITELFRGAAGDRPGCIVHPGPDTASAEEPPPGLTQSQTEVWRVAQSTRRRPLGGDDFVPALSIGAGTCALATAFGCEETQASGVFWVKPCISRVSEIDHLRLPPVTAGKLAGVLEQTRAYAEFADERLPIRIMDFQSPFTTVEQMLGSERFFLMPYDQPVRLHMLMDLVTDFSIAFYRAQFAAAGPACCPGMWPPIWFPPCAGIQMSDDNLVNVSPAVYEEFVVPYNSRIADAFGGLFLHSCTIREPCLEAIGKIRGLTGINCDISTSVSVPRLLEVFGDRAVIAPHAYINTDTDFRSYADFMRAALSGWRVWKRLFVYPCPVLYMKQTATELPFNAAEVRQALGAIPGWRRDHGGEGVQA